jgi:hypothetical protein
MLQNVSAYKNTSVHWSKSQAEIQKLLDKYDIQETRFSNLSVMARGEHTKLHNKIKHKKI